MEEGSPFKYGKIVTGQSFVNRTTELKLLKQNILAGINTLLISPRRWGKTSLVHKVELGMKKDKKYVFVHLDLFTLRNEEEFYQSFSASLLRATSGKWDEFARNARIFLSRLTPSVSLGSESGTEFSLQLSFRNLKMVEEDVLNLPQKIAQEKGIIPVICIDEFQNIEYFGDSGAFQRKARSYWQKQDKVVYILYGSKRHMMMQLFEKKSMPFYRFGETLYLEKIKPEHFVKFIVRQFKKSGRTISEKQAGKIVSTVQSHPYYVQQLAHIVWNVASKKVRDEDIDHATEQMVRSNTLYYEREFEGLSASQINVLRAVSEGITTGLTRAEVINKYDLSSSANVSKALSALENKEIIERRGNEVEFADPVFSIWLLEVF